MSAVDQAAREYVAHGWAVIPLARGQKGPKTPGWNRKDQAITDANRCKNLGGVGLAHAYSGTCALDVDDIQSAREWFAAHGLNLDLFLGRSAKILSGRPGRCKVIFALEEPLPSVAPTGSGFELRCATRDGATVQDVLPPSIHPDTGEPYRWEGDWRWIDPIPTALLSLWRKLAAPSEPQTRSAAGMSEAEMRESLARLDPACGYQDWIKVGMALHHETGGAEVGLDIWDEWSRVAEEKYPGREKLAAHWRSFGRSDAVVTMRSIGVVAAPTDFEALENTTKKPGRVNFVPAPKFIAASHPGWIIKHVLPRAPLAVVYGDAGAGKTFVVLDMAAAISRGVPWRGNRVKCTPVAYVCAEGGEFFSRRLAAYQKEHGCQLDNLYVWDGRPNLLRGDDHKAVIQALRELSPGLVIIDTLARAMPGGAENASEDMGAVLDKCSTIARELHATVLLVHHSGKDATKGARGWSGLRAAADAEIAVIRDPQSNARVIRIGKQKDSADGVEYPFTLGVVHLGDDEDGDPITSCVVQGTPLETLAVVEERHGS